MNVDEKLKVDVARLARLDDFELFIRDHDEFSLLHFITADDLVPSDFLVFLRTDVPALEGRAFFAHHAERHTLRSRTICREQSNGDADQTERDRSRPERPDAGALFFLIQIIVRGHRQTSSFLRP